ncbi:unnamed protein product [Sphenostylis stenocarpa]|uniref:DUF4220 domain-containing protein n=1 Tax=Sphenostylis stenocarpa TaxID=92480 RepID=A0AA86T3B0_9FABA|nr:unnamed protein product [Sphenostylis stenocarpa]
MSIEGHRRLAQIIPDHVQEWWDKWEIRGLILISLLTQIILTALGNRTIYKPNMWTKAILWSAYLLADWIAAVAMGVISSNLGNIYNKREQPKSVDPQLLAFWAPFFLMHLGGPDTITAYALEDNELWRRNFVGLVSQTILTVYVLILSWKGIWLSYLTIPVLIIGFIKYGERTWSLYRGSVKHLRDSFHNSLLDSSRRSEQWEQSSIGQEELRVSLRTIYIFISLFVDLVLTPLDITQDRRQLQSVKDSNCSILFTWVKFELKTLYDVFYTKAFANYGIWGFISRLITLSTTIVVLVLYANLSEEKEYQVVDHIITYLLLVGAIIGEIHAFILVTISRWTVLYFSIKGLSDFCLLQNCLHLFLFLKSGPISLGQLTFSHLVSSKSLKMEGDFLPMNKLESTSKCVSCSTSNNLLETIFESLKGKSQSNPSGTPGYRNLLSENNDQIFSSELEFHRTIIIWHIATELFYYSSHEPRSEVTRRNSKEMSDYMFYLLVKQRHMLPVGAGSITLHDTVIDAKKYFRHVNFSPQQQNSPETCRKLLEDDKSIPSYEATEKPVLSVLFHAREVAKRLLAPEDKHDNWVFIEKLWIEILCYAGTQCRVDMHAHQLTNGPEFLTHIWLLQAHLGLLDQFQIKDMSLNPVTTP